MLVSSFVNMIQLSVRENQKLTKLPLLTTYLVDFTIQPKQENKAHYLLSSCCISYIKAWVCTFSTFGFSWRLSTRWSLSSVVDNKLKKRRNRGIAIQKDLRKRTIVKSEPDLKQTHCFYLFHIEAIAIIYSKPLLFYPIQLC